MCSCRKRRRRRRSPSVAILGIIRSEEFNAGLRRLRLRLRLLHGHALGLDHDVNIAPALGRNSLEAVEKVTFLFVGLLARNEDVLILYFANPRLPEGALDLKLLTRAASAGLPPVIPGKLPTRRTTRGGISLRAHEARRGKLRVARDKPAHKRGARRRCSRTWQRAGALIFRGHPRTRRTAPGAHAPAENHRGRGTDISKRASATSMRSLDRPGVSRSSGPIPEDLGIARGPAAAALATRNSVKAPIAGDGRFFTRPRSAGEPFSQISYFGCVSERVPPA